MSSEITRDGLVAITIVQGTAGVTVYLNGYRVAGAQPTVNDKILCECTTNVEDLEQVLRDWKRDRQLMVCADPECDAPLREYRGETVVRPGWVRRAYTCVYGHTTQVSHRYKRADQQSYWPEWPPDISKEGNGVRTKRIKSKYPWHQIPEQFIWAARDDNGEVWAFTCQPVYDAEAGIWWFGEGNAAKNDVWEVTQADKPRNAAATLEARPVPKEANA